MLQRGERSLCCDVKNRFLLFDQNQHLKKFVKMPGAKKSKSKATNSNGPVTRSKNKEVELTTYTTLNGSNSDKGPIQE